MKSILTSIVFLVSLLSSTTKASEPDWEIINLKSDDIIMNNYIDILCSFDSDHLFSARSMIHIYARDKNPVQLINFIDWDTYMNDVSYKSDTAIVVYGVYFNYDDNPFIKSSFVFEVIPRDTIPGQSWKEYEWESYSYDQGVFGDHRTIYSNVNAEGNGILVIQDSSKVMNFSNWIMTEIDRISGYLPILGYFHNGIHFLICLDDDVFVLMKSYTGTDWVTVGEIADKNENNEIYFKKLLIHNDLEFFLVGEYGFYYSNDAGQNWEYLKVTDNKINGAAFRNDSELFLCGSTGFICKVNIQNNETTYFESLTNYTLYSIHFPDQNVGWAGGDYMTLLKYSTTVSVDEQINHGLSDLRIIPNPASDYVDIYVGDELFNIENNTVEIISTLGIVMTKQNIDIRSENSMLKRLDISKFPQGIYFVKFGNKIEKFIKI